MCRQGSQKLKYDRKKIRLLKVVNVKLNVFFVITVYIQYFDVLKKMFTDRQIMIFLNGYLDTSDVYCILSGQHRRRV